MWNWPRRIRGRDPLDAHRHHKRRLRIEPLESRICPSAVTISSFAVASIGEHDVRLWGFVADEHPATVAVQFTGVASGGATPNSVGYFELTTPASALGSVTAVAQDDEGLSSAPATAQLTSQVPSITGLTVMETGTGRMVTVSGTVVDEFPANRTVTLSGVVSGTATTGPTGSFSTTLLATALGTVTATTTDPWGQVSPTAQAQLTSPAPTMTLSVMEAGGGKFVTVSGTVSDQPRAGLTVTIAGVASGTAVTDTMGNYSVTLAASGLGQITASTVDVWGQASNTAQANLQSAAPSITNFTASHTTGNLWTFTGFVGDERAAGLTVTFGGLLAGFTTTVGSTGMFYFTIELASGIFDIATAQVTDWWGLTSNVAQVLVDTLGT